VNYFGHAAIASWRGEAPATALGAMLPDFATMSGGKLARAQADAAVAAGVDLHHATDGVFHALAPVQAQMRELDARLGELGCARGPRLAVAHVGIELLLDGVLVADAALRATYLAAIADDSHVGWDGEPDAARFATLRARLRTFGVPDDLADTSGIVYRLQRVLGSRPRLAPNAADLAAIATALAAQQPRVIVAADTIVRALRAARG
jgi:hypothetical protein